jgi:tRNA A-37 threonylcarbamoyl transferase component Bud32
MDKLIGRTFGKYEIQRELGRGGMAAVYLAYQGDLDRHVALKVLPREFMHERNYLERFRREVRTIANLRHPHILTVHDFGEEDGWTYLVMNYVEGDTLADRIEASGNQMSLPLVVRITGQIASALDFAHGRGIIHRDIKPANVLMDQQDNAYLADFGIVKLAEANEQLTGSGMVGTPSYMAPEMSGAGSISPLVDVYALGVTLYQMLTGELPYKGDTPVGVMMGHTFQPIPDARTLRPDIPTDFQRVINRTLDKDPAKRYQSAGAIFADLQQAGVGQRAAATLIEVPAAPTNPAGYSSLDATMPEAVRPYGSIPATPPPPVYQPPARHDTSAPPPAMQTPRTKGSTKLLLPAGIVITLVVCVGLPLLVGGTILGKNMLDQNATAAARETAVAEAQASGTANTIATHTAAPHATATAQEQASATAQAQATGTENAQATASAEAQSNQEESYQATQDFLSGLISNAPIAFGLEDRTLRMVDNGYTEGIDSGTDVTNFFAIADFFPHVSGRWSIGYIFRSDVSSGMQYLMVVRYTGEWEFGLLDADEANSYVLIDSGKTSAVSPTANNLLLIVHERYGEFHLNDTLVTELDLSEFTGSGTVWACSDFYPDDTHAGTVDVEGFGVWELP